MPIAPICLKSQVDRKDDTTLISCFRNLWWCVVSQILEKSLVLSWKLSHWGQSDIFAFWNYPNIWPLNEWGNLVLHWLFTPNRFMLPWTSRKYLPFYFLGLLFHSCWPHWFLIFISSQHLGFTGGWTRTDSGQIPALEKATRLTDFRPRNGSLATFKLFTSTLCKILSS